MHLDLKVAGSCLLVTLASSLACGSSVETTPPGTGASGQGGSYTFLAGSGGGGEDGTPVTPPKPPIPPDYDDPGCMDYPPPVEDYTCDPFKPTDNGCMDGEGCYIYVDYPSEPCGQEHYGSYCAPAGTGQQGDGCEGGNGCGAGHVCVVTGSGTQCVRLCKLEGPSGCEAGLVCEPIDVKGFGGCL